MQHINILKKIKKAQLNKEGKLANLIILDENPLTIDPMKIKDIKVLQTIREGEVLYSLK